MERLAFVIQRYGEDVNGGAEQLCRRVAEELSRDFSIKVLTTCARDYLTWANHYKPGRSTVNGVRVRRFPVARTRRVRAFGRFSQRIYGRAHTFAQEAEWMERQGPDVPDLYGHIAEHRGKYDLLLFFTYLYPPTFFGLPLAAERGLLVPCAHDEPPLRLGIFRSLFHLPRGIIFNTEEERLLIHRTFRNDYIPWTVGGSGIDLPERNPSEKPEDYLLYLGRVDVEKGCSDLFDYFQRYKKKRPSSLTLLLAGDVKMKVPRRKDITPLGFVSDGNKRTLLANARAVIVPSRYESLSLVALEAWAAGTPVIARSDSPVLAGHLRKSRGGWLFGGYREFAHALDESTADDLLRQSRGRAGREYVERNYGWERVLTSYRTFLRKIARRAGQNVADRH